MHPHRTIVQALLSSLLLTSLTLSVSSAQFSYSVIYRSPAPDNAAQPPLAAARTGGALYATTENGVTGNGSVISLTQEPGSRYWKQTIIYNTSSNPNAGLAVGADGSVYGTTLGTAFQLSPPAVPGGPWIEKTIFTFEPPYLATGHLVIDPAGNLYGTVESNPNDVNPLAIYRLTAPTVAGGAWTGNRIYNFPSAFQDQGGLTVTPKGIVISTIANTVIALQVSADGQTTTVTPIFDLAAAGLLTTDPALLLPSGEILLPEQHASQYGDIIALSPPAVKGEPWTESVIFSFSGIEGQYPGGALSLGKSGVVYGTTFGGGTGQDGTVFQLTPPPAPGGAWAEKVLHNFLGGEFGQQPNSGTLISGSGLFGLAGISGDNLNVLAFEITAAQ